MALPSSGPLSLTDIQTEFGGSNPIGINEYYAGGGLVPAGTTGTYGAVPTSGQISIQNFYGTANYYTVNNSLRFRASASARLSRTPSVAGNRTTWTWSGWVKRSNLGARGGIFGAVDTYIEFIASDVLEINLRAAATNYIWTTSQVFRDPSAWYHIVLAVDTTQATATNRMKLYVNGSQVTAFASSATIPQNTATAVNNTVLHTLGSYNATTDYLDGYQAECYLIDGQALTPSSFGATNSATGVWQPKAYTGTYGTNGFYLKFSDIALTSGSNAGLGKDFSGNGNYWNTTNISVTAGTTYDAMTDSPTWASATVANYAVLNPLWKNSNLTLAGANLNVTSSGNGGSAISTIAMESGKYYCEVKLNSSTDATIIGMVIASFNPSLSAPTLAGAGAVGYYVSNGTKFINGTQSAYGASCASGDTVGIAVDITAGTITFYKNNVSQGAITHGLTGPFYYATSDASSGSNIDQSWNFGQRPFTYTPPTGFVALNTYNLATPTIGATSNTLANKYMDATLYTGTSAVQSITNAGAFKPDYLWIKCRSAINNNSNFDSTRGVLSQLFSNLTDAQSTTADGFTAFNSNGFSLDNSGSGGNVNVSGRTYVAWQWNANNGTTSTNNSGSITSTVQANTTAGFSIVTYTGTGANATVGHGLGVAPYMIIVKNRSVVNSWNVYHNSLGGTKVILLNSLNAANTTSAAWNNTSPTSTVFSLSTDTNGNGNGNSMVAYCWAEIAGFSKFGSYTANGSTDGPFIYLGFRPKFVMIKNTNLSTENWLIMDSSRDTYNLSVYNLWPNLSSAEQNGSSRSPQVVMDFLSNGIKLRGINGEINSSTNSYIYAAFAESPFKYALAR